jgi:PAS domain S-box-containing protein
MRETEILPALADRLPLMLWAAGTDRRYRFFNRSWLEFTGQSLETELAQGWLDDIHPSDVSRCSAAYTGAFDNQHSFVTECRLRRYDGNYRWVVLSGAPQFASDGRFCGYVGSCIEIGDRLPDQESLSQNKQETIGFLAAGIGHDLNNLLAGILADADLALADVPPGSVCEEELDRIRTIALRASEIVREFMVYVGPRSDRSTQIEFSTLVQETLDLLKSTVSKHVKLTADLCTGPLPVLADPVELRQLVMNLVLNATDAVGPLHGNIRVETSRAKLTSGDCGPELAPGEYVKLHVADNGPGITSAVQKRIFEPYFTTKPSGRGLGLSIVRRIVTRYHGAIRFDSSPGEGTRFVVLLPLASVPKTSRWASGVPRRTHARRIMFIEHDRPLRSSVSKSLRSRGFRVIEATDPQTAIERLRDQEDVDALLLDVSAGDIGTEAILTAAGQLSKVKIVLTSTGRRLAGKREFAGVRIDGFVRKPYDVDALARVLAEVLEEPSSDIVRTAGVC